MSCRLTPSFLVHRKAKNLIVSHKLATRMNYIYPYYCNYWWIFDEGIIVTWRFWRWGRSLSKTLKARKYIDTNKLNKLIRRTDTTLSTFVEASSDSVGGVVNGRWTEIKEGKQKSQRELSKVGHTTDGLPRLWRTKESWKAQCDNNIQICEICLG